MIAEFLADNADGITDEDGAHSDWIELENTGIEPVDLTGWRLTDTADNPSKWVLPAGIVLPPGGRLLVFASGKNRRVPGKPLHTNFNLRKEGEYLALLPPFGVIPATAFSPAYPPQTTDVSYGAGLRVDPQARIQPGSPARLQAVEETQPAAVLTWTGTDAGFDDQLWREAVLPVGMDAGAGDPSHPLLGYWDFNDVAPAGVALDTSGLKNNGTLVGIAKRTASGGGRTGLAGDFAIDFGAGGTAIASVRIDSAAKGAFAALQQRDKATVSLWCYGGPQLPAVNVAVWFNSPGGGDQRNFMVHLPWSDNTIYFDTAGCCDASTRIFREDLDPTHWRGRWNHYVFLKDGLRKEIWQNGRLWHSGNNAAPLKDINALWLGSGPDGQSPYPGRLDDIAVWADALSPSDIESLAGGLPASWIGSYRARLRTDLSEILTGNRTAVQVRIPFVLEENAAPQRLTLRLRYDDGIVAWINGIEIARDNVPATVERTRADALRPVVWNLSVPAGVLKPGTNLLALQGFNIRAADPDLLIDPELFTASELPGRYFTTPTPGEANGDGFAGLVAAPEFLPARSFLQEATDVVIQGKTPGATLRYTLDGSAPSSTHGTEVLPESSSVPAVTRIAVSNSVAIRAIAYAEDHDTSVVQTHSYILADQVQGQGRKIPGYPTTWGVYGQYGPSPGQPVPADYEMDPDIVAAAQPPYTIRAAILSLPALCLTTSISNLFDPANGLYPNSVSQGNSWVRPASAELIFPDGTRGFQIDAGLRIHGGLSRQHWHARKHSFRLGFSREFGPARLRYPLFDDSRVTSFDELTLRASSTDGWSVEDAEPWTRPKATYLRDPWMKDTQQALGWPCGHSRYVHVFLNGVYWGQYNLAERTEAAWLAENEGGSPEDYDIIKDVNELESGTRTVWDTLLALAGAGLSTDAAYWKLQGRRPDGTRDPALPVYLDVDNLIDYMALHIYAGAIDWPNHNWWAARRRGDNSPGFRFYTWDQEISNISLTATSTYTGEAFESVSGPTASPAFLYAKLRANALFRRRFSERVVALTTGFGILTPSQNSARWERRQSEIDFSIVAESARWGDSRQTRPLKRSDWLQEMTWMRGTYWPSIHAIAQTRFRNVGLYSTSTAPTVVVQPAGGVVNPGSRVILSGGTDIYYTLDGTDPINPGGTVAASARKYVSAIAIVTPIQLRARRQANGVWTSLVAADFLVPSAVAPPSSLAIAEIHYHPATNELQEFVEVHNASSSKAILGGGRLSGGIDFIFPNGLLLDPGQRTVVVRDRAAFETAYGNDKPVAGTFLGALDNKGDRLHLLMPSGKVAFRVHYNDGTAWPALADGRGRSLTQRHARFPVDPNEPASWRPSSVEGGTPGWDDGLPLPEAVDAATDADGDGWTAFEEYFWGTNDQLATEVPTPSFQVQWTGDGRPMLAIQHPIAADQLDVVCEQSIDLKTWTPLDARTVIAETILGSTALRTFLLPERPAAAAFYRLQWQLR